MKTIKDLPEHSRPREKLREKGACALTDEELVAAILGMGTAGVDVRTIARQVAGLIREHKAGLALDHLPAVPGVGLAKAGQILSAFELARRHLLKDTVKIEKRGRVKVELIMIRPDTLAEGLKATQPEMLFSPLALPDIDVAVAKNGKEKQIPVTLKGVALFDRKRRTTEYKAADSGYVSAWYLDENYDGDCFVDCQMFFDFKKTPNIKAALSAEVDPDEFTLKLASKPFPVRGHKRIAVKVVDVYGNESTVVRDLP